MGNFVESSEFIKSKLKNKPKIAIILGSGLGNVADEMKDCVYINYSDIPDFPKTTIEGHKGRLVSGKLANVEVIAMQGRYHYYEGYSIQTVIYPIRVLKLLGIESIIVTNAAGGINTEFSPGDLMIIEDHINGMGINPLNGNNNEEFGPRFPDMSQAYNKTYIEKVELAGTKLGLKLKKGVYYATTGPNYETPAEVRMIRMLGADAVGMSTVPEVIVANHMSIKVLGISCITNMAAGIFSSPLSHKEVLDTTEKVNSTFKLLIGEAVKEIAKIIH